MHYQISLMYALIISFIIYIILTLIIFYLLYRYLNQRLLVKEFLDKEVAKVRFDIEEATLNNISENLHNNIQPDLVIIQLFFERLKSLPMDELLTNANFTAHQTLVRVINQVRHLSQCLNSKIILENGLYASIDHLIGEINIINTISAKLHINGYCRKLKPETELSLYRIIQEAITNSIKHSDATEIMIAFDFIPGKLILTYQDNGIGFDVASTLKNSYKNKSSGLQSIINRAKAINASFYIISNSHQGTTIHITI